MPYIPIITNYNYTNETVVWFNTKRYYNKRRVTGFNKRCIYFHLSGSIQDGSPLKV